MLSQVITTTPISELMNTDLITVHPEETMLKVKEVFDQHEFHHLPIVEENGKIVGMLSRMDYNRVLSSHMLFNREKNESYNRQNLQSLQVKDIMNKNVVCVKATEGLNKAVSLFRENQFHALPVVDEDRKIIGIITTFDLLIFAYC